MAGLSVAGRNASVNGLAAAGSWLSMHTADPAETGTSEVVGGTYARKQTTWGAASNGSRVGSRVSIPIPAGTSIHFAGLWSAETAGTFLGSVALPAVESFGSGGVYEYDATLSSP